MSIENWVKEYAKLAERESSPALRYLLGETHWHRLAERPTELAAQIALESAAGVECLLIFGFEQASRKAGAADQTTWSLNSLGEGAGFEEACLALIAGCMGREALGLGITPRSGRNATMLCFGCGLAEDVLKDGLISSLCDVLESMNVDSELLKSWQSKVFNGDIQSSLMNLAEDVGSALASTMEQRALNRQIQPGIVSRTRTRI